MITALVVSCYGFSKMNFHSLSLRLHLSKTAFSLNCMTGFRDWIYTCYSRSILQWIIADLQNKLRLDNNFSYEFSLLAVVCVCTSSMQMIEFYLLRLPYTFRYRMLLLMWPFTKLLNFLICYLSYITEGEKIYSEK